MAGIPMGIYRVRVSHEDAEHHMSVPSSYGPTFDASYQTLAAHVLDVDPGSVDLLAEARKCAERCRAEHPDTDGYTTRIVHLHDIGVDEAGDRVGGWEEVE